MRRFSWLIYVAIDVYHQVLVCADITHERAYDYMTSRNILVILTNITIFHVPGAHDWLFAACTSPLQTRPVCSEMSELELIPRP
jgi:hypothetical protein